ncbi:MAG: carbon-nitrogen hydrolase family protein [Chloroflexi bacterium]|nr:carbon-nitrogen hydrolase family protein [Chloroflexota bacterium]
MKESVRVAAVQMGVTWLDPQANLGRIERAMGEVAAKGGADLVVFPELVNLGYIKGKEAPDFITFAVDYVRKADKVPGPFSAAVGELARRHGCYVVVGMAEAHPVIPATVYNSAVLINPEGKVVGVHRKAHIPGEEKHYFYPGGGANVYATEVGKVGMMVCADGTYPELARVLTLKGAEIICIPYARSKELNPDPEVFFRVISCRAYENSNFVIGCNRVGREEKNQFAGRSCIGGPWGQFLALSEGEDEEILTATLRREDMEASRVRHARFRDRRPELYGTMTEPL